MKPHHELYLERTARELSRRLGRRLKSGDVLELLVEMAIEDEGVYEPETGTVLSTARREAVQPVRVAGQGGEPAGRFAPQLLLRRLQGED